MYEWLIYRNMHPSYSLPTLMHYTLFAFDLHELTRGASSNKLLHPQNASFKVQAAYFHSPPNNLNFRGSGSARLTRRLSAG